MFYIFYLICFCHFSSYKGYSLYQIQSKTDLGKPTIERTKNKMNKNKNNSKKGCFFKLSLYKKQFIIY